MSPKTVLILSAEHASCAIPPELQKLWPRRHFNYHWVYDKHSKQMAELFQKQIQTKLFVGKWGRIVADLNRVPDHPEKPIKNVIIPEKSFGWKIPFNQNLTKKQHEARLKKYYYTYFDPLYNEIARNIVAGNNVLHLSIHSFVRKYRSKIRPTHMGILFDETRKKDREVAEALQQFLRYREVEAKLNYPYKDVHKYGIQCHIERKLRSEHKDVEKNYLCLTLEFQIECVSSIKRRNRLSKVISTFLKDTSV